MAENVTDPPGPVVDRVLQMLEIDAVVRLQVRAALMGDAPHRVAIVDDSHNGVRWVVLSSLDADGARLIRAGCPLLVKASITGYSDGPAGDAAERLTEAPGWLSDLAAGTIRPLLTEQVVRFFRDLGVVRAGLHLRGLGPIADSRPATWVPAATRSTALVPMAGDLGPKQMTTGDDVDASNRYDWFDLAHVPDGGSVWRLSGERTLWVFTREPDGWTPTVVRSATWPSATSQGSAPTTEPDEDQGLPT